MVRLNSTPVELTVTLSILYNIRAVECHSYEPMQCQKLLKPPYVCNGCPRRMNCLMEQKVYSSKYADDCYHTEPISCREGINQTPESIQRINNILTPLIKKGQSIGHIYATHADEIGCSRGTTYSYIDNGVFDIINLDLRRKVKYKKRKKSTSSSLKSRAFRINRTYKDFQELLSSGYTGNIVELDTVEGLKGTRLCFNDNAFKCCNLMLIFLLKEQIQSEIKRIFDYLMAILGLALFQKLFEVILTDNGTEFQNPDELELTVSGEKRNSFNGHSPYELSQFLLDNRLHTSLNLEKIAPDDVNLTPGLLK